MLRLFLQEFDMKPIVVEVLGESSSGKSGLLLLYASVWGSPKEKVKAGNHELSMFFPLFIILYLSYI
ncbi:DUF927 domain-containing protein [Peribacillus frigoritolerans]|uniref:DUF927 domain-containing protein n=1 Tax=Peribacillus frigoritolerans TaxID=450367 RepID=UPI00342FA51F